MLDEDLDPMDGEVEIDEAYFGGRRKGKRGRGAANKTAVIGIADRSNGTIEARAVPNTKSKAVLPIIKHEVKKGAQIYTDEYAIYNPLRYMGYGHERILHSHNIYVMGNVHTNTIDGFWSLVKNGIKGVYHHCSPKYLQNYLDEYTFRYNHRKDTTPMFLTFLRRSALIKAS